MDREYRIKEEKVISDDDSGKLTNVTYEIRDRHGSMDTVEAEVYHRANAVVVLLYNKAQGTVILTRQFRIATVYKGNRNGILTEVCAGMIEGGASPEDTVRREIEEETGHRLHDVVPVMKLFMTPGVLTEMLHFYVAAYSPEDKKSDGGGLAEEGEHIELLELPYTEATSMMARGEIIDAKTVILLQYARLHGLL